MNLDEIRFYRKLLRLQKSFCCALALTTLLSLPSSSCKRNNSNNISMSSSVSFDKTSRDVLLNNVSVPVRKAIVAYKTRQVLNNVRDVANAVVDNVEKASDYLYSMCELSYPEKMQVIMEREGYTYDQLDAVCAGCVSESCGDPNCYDEAYRVASTIDNRTHSDPYVRDINKVFGENAGYSIYYQFIAPSQFSVYESGSYKKYLGRIDLVGYQAAIDMFYSGVPIHNYLNFNYIPDKNLLSYQLEEPTGNYYCRELAEENRIPEEDVLKLVLEID